MKRFFSILAFISFAGLMLFLSFNIHSRSGYFNYHSEIWADKAGYYVYLPALFEYDFQARNFPDSMDVKTGNGFQLDLQNNKVKTKYTYGVALMQLPFYLLADFAAPSLNQKTNGFSPVYHWAVNVASVFYLVMGMVFLWSFLRRYFDRLSILLVLFSVLAGTNLYYYSVDETGMSHVYSFFLFSLLLYLLKRSEFLIKGSFVMRLMIFATAGIILLIRPSNVLFVLFALFLLADDSMVLKARFLALLKPLNLIMGFIVIFLVFLPQFIYWTYLKGSFITYTYTGEAFYWLKPAVIRVLFAPMNGLLTFSPFYLVIIVSFFYLIKTHRLNGTMITLLFIALLYVVSCWWDPLFGCSFGARNFVEYSAVFSIPLAYFYRSILQLKFYKQLWIWFLILLLIIVNMKLTYTFDDCFFGDGVWDWNEYIRLLFAPTF